MPYWFDGNNLIGQSAAAAKANAEVRKAFLSRLSSLHRSGGGRFLVYFDGDEPVRSTPPPGVAIRYSAPMSADEAILCRLREIQHPGEVIIVTNDLALMARCKNEGATVMSWQDFMSKMQTRSARRSARKNPEKPVDVDDWIQYFGLDKSKI
ncbi:MAG: NYN domain-containing protein [Acidobacteria bacterium]|nr:NYN domain-containing protein [Acidobacteriota bacterium]